VLEPNGTRYVGAIDLYVQMTRDRDCVTMENKYGSCIWSIKQHYSWWSWVRVAIWISCNFTFVFLDGQHWQSVDHLAQRQWCFQTNS